VIRSGPVSASRKGRTISLELRELLIRQTSPDCRDSAESRLALIFDPATGLTWWRTLHSDDVFKPSISETEDRIAVLWRGHGSIQAMDSIEQRQAGWNEFQGCVLNLLWRGFSRVSTCLPITFLHLGSALGRAVLPPRRRASARRSRNEGPPNSRKGYFMTIPLIKRLHS
jgi:hypothetical protein